MSVRGRRSRGGRRRRRSGRRRRVRGWRAAASAMLLRALIGSPRHLVLADPHFT